LSRARGKVLVVDDEPDILQVASTVLTSLGLDVILAASGPEALEKAGPATSEIDLLITDLIMPGMTGRLLADRMTARIPDLDVIFMSGHIDADRIPRDGETDHFIQKPFRVDDLRTMVRTLLDKRRKTC
jgi:two-component system cell cycle sensor histidine kinase/response regulator CckA